MSEMVVLAMATIGVVVPTVTVVIYGVFSMLRQNKELEHKKWCMKYTARNPELRIPKKELAKYMKGDKGIIEQIGGIDKSAVKRILDLLQEGDESEGGVTDILQEVVGDHPELVDSLIKGFLSNKGKSEGSVKEGY